VVDPPSDHPGDGRANSHHPDPEVPRRSDQQTGAGPAQVAATPRPRTHSEELAKDIDTTPDKVRQLRHYTRQPVSLEQTLGEEDDYRLGDLIEDTEAVIPVEAVLFTQLQDDLHSVLTTLPEREASIVRLRFGLTDGYPRTLEQIGQLYGLTRERIRQIEAKTMTKLRQPSRCQVLRDYLD